jgi:hypothetical protein
MNEGKVYAELEAFKTTISLLAWNGPLLVFIPVYLHSKDEERVTNNVRYPLLKKVTDLIPQKMLQWKYIQDDWSTNQILYVLTWWWGLFPLNILETSTAREYLPKVSGPRRQPALSCGMQLPYRPPGKKLMKPKPDLPAKRHSY